MRKLIPRVLALLTFSEAAAANRDVIGLAVVAMLVACWVIARHPTMRLLVLSKLVRFPLARAIFRFHRTSVFCRNLNVLLSASVPLITSLRILADMMAASGDGGHWTLVTERVRQGGKLSQALVDADTLPSMAVRMLRLGEETGQLPILAERVGEFYETKLHRSLDRLTGLIGPLAIVAISIIIGGLIVVVMTSLLSISQLVESAKRAMVNNQLKLRRKVGRARKAERGFTLVEILVVITIIALVMSLVGPRVLNYLGESKVKAAKIQIESLASALDLYFLDVGRYPSNSEGLDVLVQRSGNAANWNGPYLRGNVVPTDPWGRPYIYRTPGRLAAYDIVSFGTDGQEGGTGAASDIIALRADDRRGNRIYAPRGRVSWLLSRSLPRSRCLRRRGQPLRSVWNPTPMRRLLCLKLIETPQSIIA